MTGLDLNVEDALDFYRDCVIDPKRKAYYDQYGFAYQKSVTPKNWEVFAAILLRETAKPGTGADLHNYEVKSAIRGSGYEYQYHRNTGLQKLEEDKQVDHVFIARSTDYHDIEVWLVKNEIMQPVFDEWFPKLIENYKSKDRQRFRKSVTYSFVAEKGEMILRLEGGKLAFTYGQPPLIPESED